MNAECSKHDFWHNSHRAQTVLKQLNYLEKAIGIINKIEQDLASYIELIELAEAEKDETLIAETEKEISNLVKFVNQHEVECMFSGEADANNSFVEIHSGAGGTESDDWASMLMRMYTRWAERHKFKVEIVDYLNGEEAGIKYCTLKIQGHNAYGWLKFESGVHRLVRISPFNSAGKRHTSFASIWVYPVIDDNITIEINESDLRIDTYRSSGAGGQHVNTTDSAVRITHIPTNIVVQSQSNRSQHRNKDECMSMLKSRLYEQKLKEKEIEANQLNAEKKEIGWGHQIRSYVLHPYRMVKDLRTGYQEGDTSAALDGEIDNFMRKILTAKLTGQGLPKSVEDLE